MLTALTLLAIGLGTNLFYFSVLNFGMSHTYLFALYAKLWNGRAAQYNNIDGFDVPPGADPQQLAFGITHSF